MWFIRSQAGVSKLLESTRNTLMIIFVCKLIRFKITKESTVYILINSVFLSNILFNHKSNERFCFISSKMLWTIFPRKSFFAKYFWIIWFVSHFVCADNQDLMLFRLLQHKPVMFSIRVSIQSNRVTQILKRKKNVSYNNYKKNKNLTLFTRLLSYVRGSEYGVDWSNPWANFSNAVSPWNIDTYSLLYIPTCASWGVNMRRTAE